MCKVNRREIIMMVVLFSATVFMASNPAVAEAQNAQLSVRVVLASNEGSGVDGSLNSIASPLRSRFGQYSSFQLLASHSVNVSQGGSSSISLPSGESMSLSFLGMSGTSYRIRISLPGGGTTVTAPPGGIFFVAGPRHQGGIIIIAITP